MDVQSLLNKEDKEPIHSKIAAPKEEPSSVKHMPRSQQLPCHGVTPTTSPVDNIVNTTNPLEPITATNQTTPRRHTENLRYVELDRQRLTATQLRDIQLRNYYTSLSLRNPSQQCPVDGQSQEDYRQRYSDSLNPNPAIYKFPTAPPSPQQTDRDEMSCSNGSQSSQVDVTEPLPPTPDPDFMYDTLSDTPDDSDDDDDYGFTDLDVDGDHEDDGIIAALPNPTAPPPVLPVSPVFYLNSQGRCVCEENCTIEAEDGVEDRKVISHFFGRNKACTLKIRDEWWCVYCRKHYQRTKYRCTTGSHKNTFPYVQLGLVRETIENMRASNEVTGFEIALRARAKAHLVKTEQWLRYCDDARSKGKPTPIYEDKQNSIPFEDLWIAEYLGKDKSFEDVEEFLEMVKASQDTFPKNELPRFELRPKYIPGGGKRLPPKRKPTLAQAKKPIGVRKRKAPSSSSRNHAGPSKASISKAMMSRSVRQSSPSPPACERTPLVMSKKGTPPVAPNQQADLITSGFTAINHMPLRSRSALDAANSLLDVSRPRPQTTIEPDSLPGSRGSATAALPRR